MPLRPIFSGRYTLRPLYRPLAVYEDGNFRSVFFYARNRKVFSAYHKVNVFDRIVKSARFLLFCGKFIAVFKRGGIAFAERDMATCVFVEKRVIKKHARFCDRRIFADKRDFAQPFRAFVRIYDVFKRFVAYFCGKIGDFAVFKRN